MKKKILGVVALALIVLPVAAVQAQSPGPMERVYRFPFWSDGDVEAAVPNKDFHVGYRTGFVITNPSSEPIFVRTAFFESVGTSATVVLSDGSSLEHAVPPRSTINLTTPAAWRSRQRFGYVVVSSESRFFMTEQVELVRIPSPEVRTLVAEDPRISVMRVEASVDEADVVISWERSRETDTAFVFSNTTGLALSVNVQIFGGSKQVQFARNMFMAPNGTIIRTISDFDGTPSVLDPQLSRNHGYIRVDAPPGVIMTGVVFRLVGDPIVMPAALAVP